MCDRDAQLDLWRAGYAAGRAQQAAIDRGALLEGARAYQRLMLGELIGVLAELLADHEAIRPIGRRKPAGGASPAPPARQLEGAA